MTQGKSKRVPKGKKKRIIDPMAKKVWYDVVAPPPFTNKNVCKTLVNKSFGTKRSEDALKGRVFEASAGDLMNDESFGAQLYKLRVEDVKENLCLTSFAGMRFTKDKEASIVRKWHSKIEADAYATTTDGYSLHLFAIGITRRRTLQIKKTTYAKSSQIHKIAAKMRAEMVKQASESSISELIRKILYNIIGQEMAKSAAGVYPLMNVFVHKVKVLKAPKVTVEKLIGEVSDVGTTIQ